MRNLTDTTLALFFTTSGKSLEHWDQLGMLERELTLYRALAARVQKIYFFTYGSDDARYQSQLPENVHIVPKPRGIPVLLYSFLLPFMHHEILKNVSVYKTNQMDGSWAAVLAKKLYGGVLVVRCGYEWLQFIEHAGRGKLKRFIAEVVERIAYRRADAIIHTSLEAAEFTMHRFGISSHRITIIPNFIDTDRFAPLSTEKHGVVFVGRLTPQKNLSALIQALEGVPTTITIVGAGVERPMLETLAKKTGVTVSWKGIISQTELPAILNAHQIYILPSLYEGSPKTLLEAMSCGIACIATTVMGTREVLEDGVNGLLCDTNPESIRSAVTRLLADEQLRQRLALAARNTILERYSLGKILEQELSVYTGV